MTAVTREALCRSEFCPDPTNPDWHECIVDGNPQVEHAHIVARSRALSRRKDKNNVVALCHAHHELQTLNKWAFHEQALPFDGLLHQWLTDERGATVWSRDVASTAEGRGLGEALHDAHAPSLSAADASQSEALGPPESSEGGGTRPRTPLSPNLADAQTGDRRIDAGRERTGPSSRPHVPTAASPSIAEQEDTDEFRGSVHNRTVNRRDDNAGVHSGKGLVIAESLKILPPECLLEEALEIAKKIGTAKNQNPWDAGDWVLETEARWPSEYAQGTDYLGYSPQSLLNVVRCARTFRDARDIASFTHYQTALKVASELGVPEALHWLKRATVGRWSVTELRRQLGKALPDLYNTKPRTVRFTLDELRERAEGFWYAEAKNNGRRFLAAFLESLE